MFEIMTRRQAAEAGRTKYYTGRPCAKGHDAQRFTSTGTCVKCAAGYVKDYNKRFRIRTNAQRAGWFSYPCHPDDMEAALAYCQALDLQRGRKPHMSAEARAALPFDPVEARRLAFGKCVDLVQADAPEPYLPKP